MNTRFFQFFSRLICVCCLMCKYTYPSLRIPAAEYPCISRTPRICHHSSNNKWRRIICYFDFKQSDLLSEGTTSQTLQFTRSSSSVCIFNSLIQLAQLRGIPKYHSWMFSLRTFQIRLLKLYEQDGCNVNCGYFERVPLDKDRVTERVKLLQILQNFFAVNYY